MIYVNNQKKQSEREDMGKAQIYDINYDKQFYYHPVYHNQYYK